MKNLLRALSFLTIIPLPFVRFGQDGKDLSDASVAFPLAGAVIGIIQALLAWLLLLVLPPAPVAVFLLFAGFLLTRGLHLDGLADTADGLIGVTDREKSLKAMTDSAIGVMGAVTVLLVYLLKFTLLSEISSSLIPIAVFFMPLAGRWAIVLAGAFYKPAQDWGLGALFLRNLGPAHFIKATLLAALLLTAVLFIISPLTIPVLTGAAAALLGGLLLAAYANRRLGGLTGDILGAASELGELIFMLVFYLVIRHGQFEDAFIKVVNSLAAIL